MPLMLGVSGGSQQNQPFFPLYQGASNQWVVNHNLNKFPSVLCEDMNGNELEGNIEHLDPNRLMVTFSEDVAGRIWLS